MTELMSQAYSISEGIFSAPLDACCRQRKPDPFNLLPWGQKVVD